MLFNKATLLLCALLISSVGVGCGRTELTEPEEADAQTVATADGAVDESAETALTLVREPDHFIAPCEAGKRRCDDGRCVLVGEACSAVAANAVTDRDR